jgi:hypothetical protein
MSMEHQIEPGDEEHIDATYKEHKQAVVDRLASWLENRRTFKQHKEAPPKVLPTAGFAYQVRDRASEGVRE